MRGTERDLIIDYIDGWAERYSNEEASEKETVLLVLADTIDQEVNKDPISLIEDWAQYHLDDQEQDGVDISCMLLSLAEQIKQGAHLRPRWGSKAS